MQFASSRLGKYLKKIKKCPKMFIFLDLNSVHYKYIYNESQMNDKIEITDLQRLLQFACKDSFGRFIVKFGNYPYDTDGKNQPIEWLLLNTNTYEQDEGGLLLSKYVIDCVRYYHD
jgi:hypothetical protein